MAMAVLAFAVIIGTISFVNIRSMVATEERVEHTFKVIADAEGIIVSAVDMETGLRGFALAGKEDFLGPYQEGEEQTYAAIAALKQTVNDNQAQVDRLGEVEDIAMGALYLCSPAASYVTGDILGVNGGLERLNMPMPRAWGGMG